MKKIMMTAALVVLPLALFAASTSSASCGSVDASAVSTSSTFSAAASGASSSASSGASVASSSASSGASASGTSASASSGWAPAGDRIRTSFADDINPGAVLPEYPRPQAVRGEWLNLNGLWDYAITPADADYAAGEGKILVPFAVESSLSGVGRKVGQGNALWYERSFKIPAAWKGRRVLLNFDAVDWSAEVWVNGTFVGSHTGGYTAFSLDITSALRTGGTQRLRVKVTDSCDSVFQPRGKQVTNPGGIWYTSVTGIWQTVWLEPVCETHIANIYAVGDISSGRLDVNVGTVAAREGDKVTVELLEGGVGYSAEKPSETVLCSASVCGGKAQLLVPGVKLWSPESPYLYGLRVRVERGGKVLDSVCSYTAFRSVGQAKDRYGYRRLTLNSNPYFMFGPLDQGWWPDGLYTAPTDEALKYDIVKTRDWGWNMIRKHIKVEPARWYYWCDVLGVCVWQDMPCITDNSTNKWPNDSFIGGTECDIPAEWKANYYKEWGEIIAQLKGFPCITVWVPFNEGWGQFDTHQVVAFTRAQDSTRLVNAASGGVFCFCGDIQDCHHYPNPVMRAVEREMVNVLGEYGGIGYPVPGHLWKDDSNWGYGGTRKSAAQVLEIYADYARQLINHVRTGCSAAVYTQTTDVEVEVNGIMTYDRKVVKVDEPTFRRINESVRSSLEESLR